MSTLDLARVSRALHLDAVPRDGTAWHVTGEAFHVVTVADSGLECDCADFRIRGGPCKHIIRVGLANGDPEVIAALRLIVPNPQRRRKVG